MEADVVIVGGGPAGHGLRAALVAAHRPAQRRTLTRRSAKRTFTCWRRRARSASTALSGALLDPRSMRELLRASRRKLRSTPRSRKRPFISSPKKASIKPADHAAADARPRQLRDLHQPLCEVAGQKKLSGGHHGLHRLCRIGTADRRRRVIGVRTDDKGVDKHEPAEVELRARLRLASEGLNARRRAARIADQATDRTGSILRQDRNPQTYGIGVKELWEVPPARIAPGEVIYTMG